MFGDDLGATIRAARWLFPTITTAQQLPDQNDGRRAKRETSSIQNGPWQRPTLPQERFGRSKQDTAADMAGYLAKVVVSLQA